MKIGSMRLRVSEQQAEDQAVREIRQQGLKEG